MKALGDAIYAKFSGSNLYFQNAPEGTAAPYHVYRFITNVPQYTFDTVHEQFTVQFQSYSDEPNAVEVCSLFEIIKSTYDDCKLSVSGYRFVGMERELAVLSNVPDEGWQYTTQYRVLLEEV